MSNDQSMSDDTHGISEIRQNLVDTAVNFLLNPAVIDKPTNHKTAFLKKKGLTDAEISLAFEKAKSSPKYKEFQGSGPQVTSIIPPPVPSYQRSLPIWSQVGRLTSSLVVVGAAIFGAHYIYKNYIRPFFFGGDPKTDSEKEIEKHLLQAVQSLVELEKKLSTLEERVESQNSQLNKFLQNENNDYYATPLALREMKTEISSVKSLLLSRHQFPALPKVSSPSIPEWQLPNGNSSSQQDNVDEDSPKDISSSPEVPCASDESFVNVESIDKERTLGTDETAILKN